MPVARSSEPTVALRDPPPRRASSSIALAVLASLLPLLLMLLVALLGPRFLAAGTVQFPFTAEFGYAGIIGVAIICAALVVGYILVAISESVTDTELGQRQAQALAIGVDSREELARVRAYLAASPLEDVKAR